MQPALDFQGTRRYRPLRLLGRGGMGAVYEVVDTLTEGRLALKVMLAQEPQRLLRFKQEFRIAAELHHKNLVRLFDLGQEAGRWFFTMELIAGQDLLALLRRPTPDETTLDPVPAIVAGHSSGPDEPDPAPPQAETACDLTGFRAAMAQILDALEFLHGQGLVHRDLKPRTFHPSRKPPPCSLHRR